MTRAKIRAGGVLGQFEQRVLDGDVRAMRALVRQACGLNTLDLTTTTAELRQINQATGTLAVKPELRAAPDGTGGERLLFTGYASVTETPFTITDWLGDYEEIVRVGAFTKTLSESPDVIDVVNHDWSAIPMARTKAGTLRLSEDSTGLLVSADLDGTRADVHMLRSAMDAGELDAMSFAFYVTRQTWSPDYDQRDILEVDLDGGDVSVVTWPANPATTGTTALRARAAKTLLGTSIPALIVERARAEKRAGAKLSAATLETLQAVLDLVAGADESLNSAQPILAELMGVETADEVDEVDTQSSDGSTPSDEHSDTPTGMSLALMRLREDARRISA